MKKLFLLCAFPFLLLSFQQTFAYDTTANDDLSYDCATGKLTINFQLNDTLSETSTYNIIGPGRVYYYGNRVLQTYDIPSCVNQCSAPMTPTGAVVAATNTSTSTPPVHPLSTATDAHTATANLNMEKGIIDGISAQGIQFRILLDPDYGPDNRPSIKNDIVFESKADQRVCIATVCKGMDPACTPAGTGKFFSLANDLSSLNLKKEGSNTMGTGVEADLCAISPEYQSAPAGTQFYLGFDTRGTPQQNAWAEGGKYIFFKVTKGSPLPTPPATINGVSVTNVIGAQGAGPYYYLGPGAGNKQKWFFAQHDGGCNLKAQVEYFGENTGAGLTDVVLQLVEIKKYTDNTSLGCLNPPYANTLYDTNGLGLMADPWELPTGYTLPDVCGTGKEWVNVPGENQPSSTPNICESACQARGMTYTGTCASTNQRPAADADHTIPPTLLTYPYNRGPNETPLGNFLHFSSGDWYCDVDQPDNYHHDDVLRGCECQRTTNACAGGEHTYTVEEVSIKLFGSDINPVAGNDHGGKRLEIGGTDASNLRKICDLYNQDYVSYGVLNGDGNHDGWAYAQDAYHIFWTDQSSTCPGADAQHPCLFPAPTLTGIDPKWKMVRADIDGYSNSLINGTPFNERNNHIEEQRDSTDSVTCRERPQNLCESESWENVSGVQSCHAVCKNVGKFSTGKCSSSTHPITNPGNIVVWGGLRNKILVPRSQSNPLGDPSSMYCFNENTNPLEPNEWFDASGGILAAGNVPTFTDSDKLSQCQCSTEQVGTEAGWVNNNDVAVDIFKNGNISSSNSDYYRDGPDVYTESIVNNSLLFEMTDTDKTTAKKVCEFYGMVFDTTATNNYLYQGNNSTHTNQDANILWTNSATPVINNVTKTLSAISTVLTPPALQPNWYIINGQAGAGVSAIKCDIPSTYQAPSCGTITPPPILPPNATICENDTVDLGTGGVFNPLRNLNEIDWTNRPNIGACTPQTKCEWFCPEANPYYCAVRNQCVLNASECNPVCTTTSAPSELLVNSSKPRINCTATGQGTHYKYKITGPGGFSYVSPAVTLGSATDHPNTMTTLGTYTVACYYGNGDFTLPTTDPAGTCNKQMNVGSSIANNCIGITGYSASSAAATIIPNGSTSSAASVKYSCQTTANVQPLAFAVNTTNMGAFVTTGAIAPNYTWLTLASAPLSGLNTGRCYIASGPDGGSFYNDACTHTFTQVTEVNMCPNGQAKTLTFDHAGYYFFELTAGSNKQLSDLNFLEAQKLGGADSGTAAEIYMFNPNRNITAPEMYPLTSFDNVNARTYFWAIDGATSSWVDPNFNEKNSDPVNQHFFVKIKTTNMPATVILPDFVKYSGFLVNPQMPTTGSFYWPSNNTNSSFTCTTGCTSTQAPSELKSNVDKPIIQCNAYSGMNPAYTSFRYKIVDNATSSTNSCPTGQQRAVTIATGKSYYFSIEGPGCAAQPFSDLVDGFRDITASSTLGGGVFFKIGNQDPRSQSGGFKGYDYYTGATSGWGNASNQLVTSTDTLASLSHSPYFFVRSSTAVTIQLPACVKYWGSSVANPVTSSTYSQFAWNTSNTDGATCIAGTQFGFVPGQYTSQTYNIGTSVIHPDTLPTGSYTVSCLYGNGVATADNMTTNSCTKNISVRDDATVQGCESIYNHNDQTLSADLQSSASFRSRFRCRSRLPHASDVTNPFSLRIGLNAPLFMNYGGITGLLFQTSVQMPIAGTTGSYWNDEGYLFSTGATDVACAVKVGEGYSTNDSCQKVARVGVCNPTSLLVNQAGNQQCVPGATTEYVVTCNPQATDLLASCQASINSVPDMYYKVPVGTTISTLPAGCVATSEANVIKCTPTCGPMQNRPAWAPLDAKECRINLPSGISVPVWTGDATSVPTTDTNGCVTHRPGSFEGASQQVNRDTNNPTSDLKFYTGSPLTLMSGGLTQWYNKPVTAQITCNNSPNSDHTDGCACEPTIPGWSSALDLTAQNDLIIYSNIFDTSTTLSNLLVRDTAGNSASVPDIRIGIDTHAPVVTGTGSTSVTLRFEDSESGFWSLNSSYTPANSVSKYQNAILWKKVPKTGAATVFSDNCSVPTQNSPATYLAYPSEGTHVFTLPAQTLASNEVIAYCVQDNAGNVTRGYYPYESVACFSESRMSPVPTTENYQTSLIARITSNPKIYGYSFSDPASNAACFRSILASNINTYVASQYDTDTPADINNWDSARATVKGASTTKNTQGYYYRNGNITVSSSPSDSTIAPNTKVVIAEGGNIQINSDIKNYSSGDKVLVLIARKSGNSNGNIYISPNVTQIDAILIADGGAVLNGTNFVTKNWSNSADLAELSKPLVINGRIYSYNTRAGSLRAESGSLLPVVGNTGYFISNDGSINALAPLTQAAPYDLERFRFGAPNLNVNSCTLLVNYRFLAGDLLPPTMRRPYGIADSCAF